MASIEFQLNGQPTRVDAAAGTPLLWVLRDVLNLTGTKYGCGRMLCGACTVHVDGKATRTCLLPFEQVAGKTVTTIEGLAGDGGAPHRVQQAWLHEAVPQCGYCQSGQIMTAAALLADEPEPSDERILEVMDGVLCRCGTYQRILRAVRRAADG
jgi:isoquinoline 1-oxidoreductase subunit alpha